MKVSVEFTTGFHNIIIQIFHGNSVGISSIILSTDITVLKRIFRKIMKRSSYCLAHTDTINCRIILALHQLQTDAIMAHDSWHQTIAQLSPNKVHLETGVIKGFTDNGITKFLGVPYAAIRSQESQYLQTQSRHSIF